MSATRSRGSMTRRTLLRGAGGLGAALAGSAWVPRRGEAAEGESPRRLLLVFQPNGVMPERWWPTGSPTDWSLGENLAALEPVRDKLLFVDGVYKYGMRLDQGGGPGNEHQKGISMLWTGSRNASGTGGTWNQGTSIDQAIAAAGPAETPFASIELGVRTGGSSLGNRMIYAGPGQPLAPEDDPWAAFGRLFAGITDDPAQKAAFERLKFKRRSVIDYAMRDLDRSKGKVTDQDRAKIEAHLQGLESIEARLSKETLACTPPELGPRPGTISMSDAVAQAHAENLALAFACDLTRVASLQFGSAATLQSFDGRPHHDLSHEIADSHSQSAIAAMEAIDRWYGAQMAYLLQRLDSIPEGDGTLLDNTLVVWSNEIANGVTVSDPGRTHLMGRTPLMLAGGGNFAFETGRYLRYEQPADMNDTDPSKWSVSHQRVLVSLARAFGLDVDTYGDLDPASGPAPGLEPVS